MFFYTHWWFFFFLVIGLLSYNSYAIKITYLKDTVQWFSVYSQSFATSNTISFTFHRPPEKPHTLYQAPSSPPQPSATTNLLSVPVDLLIRDISFKWDHIILYSLLCLVSFSSVAQSCPVLCDPMDCSTPGLPVHHQLLEFTRPHVH